MPVRLVPYSHRSRDLDAHVVVPEGQVPSPAVLVCHAWGGRDAFAESKAQALADLGYVGAAIDVYGVGRRGTDSASSEALMTALLHEPATLRGRLQAAVDAVGRLPEVDADRMGAIGFCFGGLCALLMARMGLALRGVVSFHGLLTVGEPLPPDPPARMLVLHGQDDPMVPPSDVGAFAQEMKRINADWQLHAYPRTMHAFTHPAANDPGFGTVYNAKADARSWAAMKSFLAEVLQSPRRAVPLVG